MRATDPRTTRTRPTAFEVGTPILRAAPTARWGAAIWSPVLLRLSRTLRHAVVPGRLFSIRPRDRHRNAPDVIMTMTDLITTMKGELDDEHMNVDLIRFDGQVSSVDHAADGRRCS